MDKTDPAYQIGYQSGIIASASARLSRLLPAENILQAAIEWGLKNEQIDLFGCGFEAGLTNYYDCVATAEWARSLSWYRFAKSVDALCQTSLDGAVWSLALRKVMMERANPLSLPEP